MAIGFSKTFSKKGLTNRAESVNIVKLSGEDGTQLKKFEKT